MEVSRATVLCFCESKVNGVGSLVSLPEYPVFWQTCVQTSPYEDRCLFPPRSERTVLSECCAGPVKRAWFGGCSRTGRPLGCGRIAASLLFVIPAASVKGPNEADLRILWIEQRRFGSVRRSC